MDFNHIHKIPSQLYLDWCLIEEWEDSLEKLTQKTDHHRRLATFCKRSVYATEAWALGGREQEEQKRCRRNHKNASIIIVEVC